MVPGARRQPERLSGPQSLVDGQSDLQQRIGEAIGRATERLLSMQAEEGYWLGELEADTTIESDYILYLHVLGRPDPDRIAKLANYIRRRQLPDGGWNIYPGGPSELNATIKGYFGLKLAGDPAEAAHMLRARRRVHEMGGLEGAGSGHAAGVDSVPAMARLEHLQHVVVDARDCHTAHNSLRLEAALVPAFARPRRRIIRKPGRARPRVRLGTRQRELA